MCTQTQDDQHEIYGVTRQVRCEVALLIPLTVFLSCSRRQRMPSDLPYISLRPSNAPLAANPPSLTASNCIKTASNNTTTRAQPDDDDNIDLSRTKTSSRPSHPNLNHISRSSCARIHFPSIAYV
jgi:hypothetical protein